MTFESYINNLWSKLGKPIKIKKRSPHKSLNAFILYNVPFSTVVWVALLGSDILIIHS